MGSFDETDEQIQSIKMRPACNRVLCEVFDVSEDQIIRYENKDSGPHILDKEYAVDLRITMNSGAQITGQEKALTYKFYSYKTFTIEFYQNRKTCELGEFFKIASQFYLSGYSDQNGYDFIEWHILNTLELMAWLKNFDKNKLANKCKPSGGSNANFLPIPYNKIPRHIFYASGCGPGDTIVYSKQSLWGLESCPPA